jgi:hypothetical protein
MIKTPTKNSVVVDYTPEASSDFVVGRWWSVVGQTNAHDLFGFADDSWRQISLCHNRSLARLGLAHFPLLSMACAMGCILAPLLRLRMGPGKRALGAEEVTSLCAEVKLSGRVVVR